MGKAAEESDVELFESLMSFRISILAKLLDRRLATQIGDQFGLGVAEYKVFGQIVLHPGATVRAIAASTFVDKAQVSRAVAQLEKQGLVSRTTTDQDRRAPLLYATTTGERLFEEIRPLRQEQERALKAELTPAQYQAMTSAIEVLITSLSEVNAKSAEPTAAERRRVIREARTDR